jgi:TonB family protein
MRIILLLLAGAALAAAVPARAQTGPCRSWEPPRPLRRAERVRDSIRNAIRDTLRTELLQAARHAGVAEPAGIVLVERTDRRTGQARAWSFRANVPDSVSQAVVARRAPLLMRWPDREGIMYFRLEAIDYPDEPVMECLPALLNREQFVREMQRLSLIAAAYAGTRSQLRVDVRMLVTREGEVAYAAVSRSSSMSALDREVLAVAEGLRFHPAAVDDVPVDVWVEQPVVVEIPDARREGSWPE